MPLQEKLLKFIQEHQIKLGKDFQSNTPFYYSSLYEGFTHYFTTFKDKKSIYHFLVDKQSFSKHDGFELAGMFNNMTISILGFHRFFELYIKDILKQIDPYLAVNLNEKEKKVFSYLFEKLEANEIKSVDFQEGFTRLKYAFKYFKKEDETYIKILKEISFLVDKESIETIDSLTLWRNKIMHNGTTLPNLVSYEFLISQQVIPLVAKIFESRKKANDSFEPHFFKTPSGIDLIENFLKIKFKIGDVNNKKENQNLIGKLFHLAHLKELGRASMSQDFFIRMNKKYDESNYDNPIGRNERFAETERRHSNFFDLIPCTCCNANSLVIYKVKYEDILKTGKNFSCWFRCFNCDYSISDNIFDPYYFELSKKNIFPQQ